MNTVFQKNSTSSIRIAIALVFSILISIFFIIKSADAFVKIGILPYKIIATHYKKYSYIKDSIPIILGSNLSSNNISVSRSSNINNFIKKNNITSFSTDNLLKISKYFNLKYLIFGRIIKIRNVFDIETNVFSPSENAVVYRRSIQVVGSKFIIKDVGGLSKTIKAKIVSLTFKEKVQKPEELQASSPVISSAPPTANNTSNMYIKRFNQNSKGLLRTPTKHYIIQSLSTGKFLNRGAQLVVATRHRVILYNLLINGGLKKLAQYNLSSQSNPIYVGSYKISKNRMAIVLTKTKLGMVISYLLAYNNGKLVKITPNYNLFLRVMRLNKHKKVIVGQNPISVIPSGRYFNDSVIGQNTYPIGQFGGATYVYRFNKNNNTLIKIKKLPFFSDITLYGTAYGNFMGNGKKYLMALSNSGNLMIINEKGETKYTGSKTYGGSPLQIQVPSNSGVRSSSVTGGLIYNVPAKVSKFYINGKVGIVVTKNYQQAAYLPHLNYFTKNSIYSLVWNNVSFYPMWKIRSVVGYSAGFSIFKFNKKTYLANAIVENSGSMFSKPKSYIALYKLSS
ncbi:MAG: hypothetical protein EVG15_10650 [Candidatus Acididesulfobacter diazotrophicus]|jgi:hypothetical protein|uniref:Uncharacterized protein n=1 Tax=Candidatus Acididesulfobacter diazotrophicus TaxID=2597226 RepID=A0A519BJU9_9DELT|nr:MAG: hypothetical protein EVG15_10650 [Candidatus Acididesulfobacter diazotrophicus]